jgi:hypothetical protein
VSSLSEIAPLTTTIKPKKAGSRLQISMNVMCCPQMVHLFTLAIYVNDKTVVTGTNADKQNTHYADAAILSENVVVTVCKTADVVVLIFFISASNLVTPEKLRTFVLDHYSRDYLTFETILNNLRSWTISRTY